MKDREKIYVPPLNSLIYFFHRLDGPGIESREVKFSAHSTQAPTLTQSPVEEVPHLSRR